MRNMILLGISFYLFIVPFGGFQLASAQDIPSISEFTNCVSVFSRRVTAREGNCRFWEFEVVVEGGGEPALKDRKASQDSQDHQDRWVM